MMPNIFNSGVVEGLVMKDSRSRTSLQPKTWIDFYYFYYYYYYYYCIIIIIIIIIIVVVLYLKRMF